MDINSLVWFRTDLRLHDHPALSAASIAGRPLLSVFISTPRTWAYHNSAPCKVDFINRNVALLQKELQGYNIPLLKLECSTYQDIPELLKTFCQKHKVGHLYFNEQYEMDEQHRDKYVEKALQTLGIKIHRFQDQTLVPPGLILNGADQPFKVFTPFKRKWLQWKAAFSSLTEAPLPLKQPISPVPFQPIDHPENTSLSHLWPAGEKAASLLLESFLQNNLQRYHIERDFPAQEGTSKLSPYLAQGVISIKSIFNHLENIPDSTDKATWINELIWREFYKHLLFLIPELCCSKSFRSNYKGWSNPTHLIEMWQKGQTGFPLIDAAMRELNTTGWMHNRMRMNVAMFLTKLLNVDWRIGERYFMQHLIDGDLAANNGGWQWAAGTGCDAAPYFRIFNPITQSKKFDPDGEYIRRYCPELAQFNSQDIHEPYARNPDLAASSNYPRPVIDYVSARKAALGRNKQQS